MQIYETIKGMTPEEMADFLQAVMLGFAPWCDFSCENKGEKNCVECIKIWLARYEI